MKRIVKWLLCILFALGVVLTFAYLWHKGQPKELNYQEVEVTLGDSILRQITLSGSIKPRDEVSIKPQIAGIISEILVEPGQDVQLGDVIARISVIPELQQVNSAENAVDQARINLERLIKVHERDKSLYQQGLIAAEEYERGVAELANARLQLSTAEQALQITRSGVSSRYSKQSSTLVRATITGKILSIPVKVGSSVIQANTFNEGTTIATIADMKNLVFEGNSDETEVGKLSVGQTMSITVGAMPQKKLSAVVEYIAPQGQSVSSAMLFPVKGKLLNIDSEYLNKLRAGFSATAEIITEQVHDVMTLPEACITHRGDSAFVQLIKSESKGRVEERFVLTGISDGAKVEIKKGLTKGDKVRGNLIIEGN